MIQPAINEDRYRILSEHLKSLKLNSLDEDLQVAFHGLPISDVRSYQLDDMVRIQELRAIRDLKTVLESLTKEVKTRLL